MSFHPMFKDTYWWAVCNKGGVLAECISPDRSTAIRKWQASAPPGSEWKTARRRGFSLAKITIALLARKT